MTRAEINIEMPHQIFWGEAGSLGAGLVPQLVIDEINYSPKKKVREKTKKLDSVLREHSRIF